MVTITLDWEFCMHIQNVAWCSLAISAEAFRIKFKPYLYKSLTTFQRYGLRQEEGDYTPHDGGARKSVFEKAGLENCTQAFCVH